MSGEQIRISVVVPSYNSGRYLREALQSALDQDPAPWEVVVQDGGSSDETLDVLKELGSAVAWVSAPDGGQADALNKAIGRATGDVVVWLNADDLLLPGAFQHAAQAFQSDASVELVYGGFVLIDGVGRVMKEYASSPYDRRRVFTHGCYIFSGSMFLRRSLLDRVGPFDPELRACMDLDFLLRLGPVKAIRLAMPSAAFRISGDGKSSTIRRVFLVESFRVRRRAARGSPRLLLTAVLVAGRDAVALATQPIRHSSFWLARRPRKTL
jgi:glycosyltransferase involved in cell wall biosynthesis